MNYYRLATQTTVLGRVKFQQFTYFDVTTTWRQSVQQNASRLNASSPFARSPSLHGGKRIRVNTTRDTRRNKANGRNERSETTYFGVTRGHDNELGGWWGKIYDGSAEDDVKGREYGRVVTRRHVRRTSSREDGREAGRSGTEEWGIVETECAIVKSGRCQDTAVLDLT